MPIHGFVGRNSIVEQAIEVYRKKATIEDVFRTIGSDVKLRPVWVRTEDRVKGHVTVCVLAYLLLNSLEHRVKGYPTKYQTSDSIIEKLSRCTIDEYQFPGIERPIRTMTKPTCDQIELFEALGLKDILLPRHIDPILKSESFINIDPPAEN
ncbi:MAG: transposase [Firmicutes bacterium]|nr:transposase [Bacillota bacterium]